MEKMRNRLPRELRDMVYVAFWESLGPGQKLLLQGLTRKGVHRDHPRPCQCLSHEAVPHIANPAYVGLEIAHEAVTVLHRIHPMDVLAVDPGESIANHLHSDVFHIGLEPHTFIRQLKWKIYLDHVCAVGDNGLPHPRQQGLQKDLNSLSAVGTDRVFGLHIVLRQRKLYMGPLEQMIEMLRPIFNKFKNGGAEVMIEHEYKAGGKNAFPPALASLNHIIETPSDTWKEDRIKLYHEVSSNASN